MKRRVFSITGGAGWSIFFLLMLSSFFSPVYAQSPQTSQPSDKPSDQAGDSRIQLLKPEEGCLNIAKKAMIKCAIKTPFDSTKLLVLLDGTDISDILDITPEGFEHKATGVLASGDHTLSITITTQDGQELKREFKFSTCHSKTFDEIYSSNEITTVAEKKAVRSGDTVTTPSWKVESNLASESKIKKGEWEFLFKTNLRYFGQDMAVTPPPDKGFSLANYLFQAKYNGSKINFLAETGDVTIDETPNTVTGLARRGGNLVFESKDLNLKLRTFDVKSEQLFGFVGGPGLGTTPNDHIMGASADLGIISDKLRFRTIYVRGGEQGDSLGTTTTTPIVTPEETPSYGNSSTTNQRKGDVLGFLLTSDFFDKKFVTEAELDFSRFDADTTDEFRAKRDKAYRLKASGTIKDYTYEALYEYVGRDYEVIGNPGLSKDKEGYSLKGGGTFFKIHLLNLSFSQYHDNVKKDDLYPRTYTTQGTLDYTFSKFENLPITLSYQRSMVSTKDEPIDILPTKTDTDTVTGQIHYKKGPWDLGFQTSYSFQKDKTPADNDNTTVTYTFTPTYTKDFLTITPSFSYNRSLAHNTGVHTDTYTATLDLKGDLFKKRVTYGLGGTYTIVRASDRSSKTDTLSSNFSVYYLLFKDLWGFLDPSVGIRGLYNRTNDRVLRQITDEFALYFVLQTSMKFLF
jgi:hypothetical protein